MAVAWQRRGNGMAMAMAWQWHGNGMAMAWRWHGDGMAMARQWHGNGMAMAGQAHGNCMAMAWRARVWRLPGRGMAAAWQQQGLCVAAVWPLRGRCPARARREQSSMHRQSAAACPQAMPWPSRQQRCPASVAPVAVPRQRGLAPSTRTGKPVTRRPARVIQKAAKTKFLSPGPRDHDAAMSDWRGAQLVPLGQRFLEAMRT